jgi:hypothetical protein
MKKLVITTALAAVLAGGAYAQGHHGGGGMGGGMGGGGHASMGGGGGGGPSMMSHGPSGGPSGPSSFSRNSSLNGPSSQFSRNNRTLFNQEHGNRLFNSRRDIDHDRFSRIGHDRDRDIDFRHRGIVRGDFFEHGRHFHFRRFFHGQFVFLVGFDDCTAWAWVNVAPGVWAWRPINVCIG